jgi:uncharacterized repeat protein (TIGR01451 family)
MVNFAQLKSIYEQADKVDVTIVQQVIYFGSLFVPLRVIRGAATWLAAATAVAIASFAADAQAGEALLTKLSALKYEIAQNEHGQPIERLVSFTKALPGESLRYQIDYANAGTGSATGVVVSLPVPKEMTYVAGSAETDGAQVEYSVDGGVSFATLDGLVVTDKEGRTRPAAASDVTTVRWKLLAPLTAGARGQLGFRAVLK